MYARRLLPSLLVAASATLVQAQTGVSLFPIGLEELNLSGEIRGTGPDGTTYVLSGITVDQPITVTLVQNSNEMKESAQFTAPGVTVSLGATCSIVQDLGIAACVGAQSAIGPISTFSVVRSFIQTVVTVTTFGVTPTPTVITIRPTSTTPSETIDEPPIATETVTVFPSQVNDAGIGLYIKPTLHTAFVVITSILACLGGGLFITML